MTTPIDELAGTPDLPVGAYVASALADANIPCDSGEDVDRFLSQLAWRGFEVRRSTPVPASNVSEGLREDAREKAIVNAWREAQRLHGDWSASWQADSDRARHFLAALAHAAPEGLDEADVQMMARCSAVISEVIETADNRAMAADGREWRQLYAAARQLARVAARLSQPDAAGEAGR